jgi:nucleotide-binding universal stress UspA family protein
MERSEDSGRIVVGVDGSKPSQRALQWAAAEGVRDGSSLVIVHAWSVPSSIGAERVPFDVARFEAEGQTIIDDAIATVADLGPDVPAYQQMVHDNAAAALLDAAEGAELLVVGSGGEACFVGSAPESVSRRCLGDAPCPVVVVPPGWEFGGVGRIVVGVDGSQPSYEALCWAVGEALRHDARLDVVNAHHDDVPVSPYGSVVTRRAEGEKASRALLERMVYAAFGCSSRRRPQVQLIASRCAAARGLLEAAEGADLLVVGPRGRGTFAGVRLGSVSQQCVDHANCPVVVVHRRWAAPIRQ